jgi:hypothetical protein
MTNISYREYIEFYSLVEEIKGEFPKFKIIPKEESPFMKFLYVATLMFLWNKHFMENYITVIFGVVYMPKCYIGTATGGDVLRHERVHMRDAHRWPILFELSYIFLPLPLIFSARAFWEYRGYCESLLAERDRYGYVSNSSIDFYVSLFCSSDYLWMFPFKKYLRNKFLEFLSKNNIEIK